MSHNIVDSNETEAARESLRAALARALPVGEERDAARLDWLQMWAEKSKFMGYKWDTFMFDLVRFTTIRGAIDSAMAPKGETP